MYMRAAAIRARDGARVLANVIASYFDRTWEHFCSHQQTPSSRKVKQPGIVRNGSCIYFAHPIFTLYRNNAPNWCKKLFLNAVDLLLDEPVLRHDGPTTLLATVNEQAAHNRWVLHLLHYIPERRCRDMDVIEDVIPLYNVKVSIRTPRPVASVACVPRREALAFDAVNGRTEFVLPKLDGHQMIEVAF